MLNFALEEVDSIDTGAKIRFKKLIIDGKCPYDDFCISIKGHNKRESSYRTILTYMNFIASSNQLLPLSKLRKIKGSSNIYEFKKDDVRIYVIMIEPMVYIITGGLKGTQNKDIKKVIKIEKEFLIKKNTGHEIRGIKKEQGILDC